MERLRAARPTTSLLFSAGSGLRREWRHSVAERSIQGFGYSQNQLVFIRPASNLNAYRQPFGGPPNRNHSGGEREEVEPLRVTHGVPVTDTDTVDVPMPLTVAERRNRTHWREQKRGLSTLVFKPLAQQIRLRPCREQRGGIQRSFGLSFLQKIGKDRAQLARWPSIVDA